MLANCESHATDSKARPTTRWKPLNGNASSISLEPTGIAEIPTRQLEIAGYSVGSARLGSNRLESVRFGSVGGRKISTNDVTDCSADGFA